jgi:hypothetical protein
MLVKLKRKLVYSTAHEALVSFNEFDYSTTANVYVLKNYLNSLDGKYFVDHDDDTGEIRIFEFY